MNIFCIYGVKNMKAGGNVCRTLHIFQIKETKGRTKLWKASHLTLLPFVYDEQHSFSVQTPGRTEILLRRNFGFSTKIQLFVQLRSLYVRKQLFCVLTNILEVSQVICC